MKDESERPCGYGICEYCKYECLRGNESPCATCMHLFSFGTEDNWEDDGFGGGK